ncbi:heme-binding protein [Mucilaginibacter sp. L196]|uniref:GlcG/HbpS family heme-binding protein n=1 Tax=Mucilaginibacter sp. L196 TaxID=1641870 RepID=UPI00131DF97B|nr:heme-binding protein [Mucilaginibacter sp. L196]
MEITLSQSEKLLDRAKSKAEEIGIPMNIAILDTAGHLKAFLRMDNAFLGSIDIAIKKAKTAMLFRMNSEKVGEFLKPEIGAYGMEASSGGLMGFAGGIPIKNGDEIVGYVGVSGGPVPMDFAVASEACLIS